MYTGVLKVYLTGARNMAPDSFWHSCFLKLETFFLLEGIFLSPKWIYIHIVRSICVAKFRVYTRFHSFLRDLASPHTFSMSQPKLPCLSA